LEDLERITEFGTVCGNCKEEVAELFDQFQHIYST